LAGREIGGGNQGEIMAEHGYRTALIVGVGSGVSASLARVFHKAGIKVALAARRVANLADLAMLSRRPSRWANLLCADWRKAWRVNYRHMAYTSAMS